MTESTYEVKKYLIFRKETKKNKNKTRKYSFLNFCFKNFVFHKRTGLSTSWIRPKITKPFLKNSKVSATSQSNDPQGMDAHFNSKKKKPLSMPLKSPSNFYISNPIFPL